MNSYEAEMAIRGTLGNDDLERMYMEQVLPTKVRDTWMSPTPVLSQRW